MWLPTDTSFSKVSGFKRPVGSLPGGGPGPGSGRGGTRGSRRWRRRWRWRPLPPPPPHTAASHPSRPLQQAAFPNARSAQLCLYMACTGAHREFRLRDWCGKRVWRRGIMWSDVFLCTSRRSRWQRVQRQHWSRIGSRLPATVSLSCDHTPRTCWARVDAAVAVAAAAAGGGGRGAVRDQAAPAEAVRAGQHHRVVQDLEADGALVLVQEGKPRQAVLRLLLHGRTPKPP